MNQKLYRTFGPITTFLVVILSASSLSANLDSIPIVIQQRVDTVITFDLTSKKEKQQIVSADIYHFATIDTTTIFDYDTYEETVEIVKNLIPVETFIDEVFEKARWEQDLQNRKIYGIDTITVFDFDTYEEFFSVIQRVDPCYHMSWGNFAMSTEHKYSEKSINSLIGQSISVQGPVYGEPCKQIDNYTLTVIIESPEVGVKAFNLSKENDKLPSKEVGSLIGKGTNIYFYNTKVNNNQRMPNVKIEVTD